jgi:AraC-like DNA-binding protein
VFNDVSTIDESTQMSAGWRPRVLVVDDDKRMRDSVASAVSSSSDVVEAATAEMALAMLQTPGGVFDLVFVCCLRSRQAPHYAAAIDLVREIFRRSPAVSVILLGDPEEAERLVADVLLSSVREIIRTPFVATAAADAVDRVVRAHRVQRPSTPQNVAAIRRIRDFLDEHVSDVPALSELAVMATMSRSHFSRTFHLVVGMPLRDYVRDLRLRRAYRLLVTSKLSLTNIAVESGFYDLPHFDKAFRHRLGISPHEFRLRYTGLTDVR